MPFFHHETTSGISYPNYFHVILTLDSTGSMNNWTSQLSNAIQSFLQKASQIPSHFVFTMVLYKDHTDDSSFLAKVVDVYTEDKINKMLYDIELIRLTGGGDRPECVGSGLALALEQAHAFKKQVPVSAYQYIVLIGDAPHHGYASNLTMDNLKNVLYRSGKRGCCENDPYLIAAICREQKMPICTVSLTDERDTQEHFETIAQISHGVFVVGSDSSGGIAQAIFQALVHPIQISQTSVFY